MKVNHINLVVSNVAEAVKLFETYFGYTCVDMKGDNVIVILKGSDDFTLVIMTDKAKPQYPKAFHIGFMQDSADKVTALHQKLKDGGVDVGESPRKIRDSFGFYFTFDEIMFEVGC